MRVILYTNPGSTSCAQAKAFLTEHHVVFEPATFTGFEGTASRISAFGEVACGQLP
jgi:arsenate reductase-like glutaredoxin family protein